MLKTFRYRLYPTSKQTELLNKHFGCVRFVYNLALETKQSAYAGNKVNLTRYDLQQQLVDLKETCPWLREINSQSLQVALMHLDASYLRFFKGLSEFPAYKKKSTKQSFNIPQNVLIENNKLIIPKFKTGIKVVLNRCIRGTIKQATINKTPTGKYFASILCEVRTRLQSKATIVEQTTIGIDLGIKSFLVTSEGQKLDNPKLLKKQLSRLKYTQRKYSKRKGKRTRQRLAILHEKVTNQRKDFLQKVSTELIKNHDSFAIENLNVSGMLQNHNLAQSIGDVGWGIFVMMLEYKAVWYNKNILKIGQFDPSSKTCSVCGNINKELTLEDRKWSCTKCGTLHDRDINAAVNIKNFALKNTVCGMHTENQNELPTLVGVMTSEI